jgi:hypothetical protein
MNPTLAASAMTLGVALVAARRSHVDEVGVEVGHQQRLEVAARPFRCSATC